MNRLRIVAGAILLAAGGSPALDDAPSKVRVGYCGPLRDVGAVKSAGFDYMEVRTSEVAALSDEDYEQLAAKLRRLALPVLAAYWFLPAEVKVTGPDIDVGRQMAYLHKAFDRVSRLGVRVIVFGSSGARQVPKDFRRQRRFSNWSILESAPALRPGRET